MANNNALFNAACAGATSGVASRWLTSEALATFATLNTAIQAFATSLDAAIPAEVGGATESQARLVESISSSFWSNRVQTKPLSTDYDADVIPLAALYQEMKTAMLSESGSLGVAVLEFVKNDDDGTVAPGAVVTHVLAVPGIILATDKIIGIGVPTPKDATGLLLMASITADDQLEITYQNPTAGGVTNGATDYTFFIAR